MYDHDNCFQDITDDDTVYPNEGIDQYFMRPDTG